MARFYLKKAAQGILVTLFLLVALLLPDRGVIVAQMLLYETMPNYKIEPEIKQLLGLIPFEQDTSVFSQTPQEDNLEAERIISIPPGADIDIIGLDDDIYQPDNKLAPSEPAHSGAVTADNLDSLLELDDLRSKFYTVDRKTDLTSADFNIEEFMAADLTIDRESPGPKVLVFHTHSTELYADSVDEYEGVLGVGRKLCNILSDKYGIETLHVTNRYDIVDGASQILGAYERMEPDIKKILNENPSIELVIDLHRDGVESGRRLATEIEGKPTAQLMFVNGLCKIYRDGILTSIDSLPNPNLSTNLALSFRAQLSANKLYPGLMRRVYLNAYRYSLHMMPKSLLIEVGAQTNTKEEAFNAVEPLADILASVILQ